MCEIDGESARFIYILFALDMRRFAMRFQMEFKVDKVRGQLTPRFSRHCIANRTSRY